MATLVAIALIGLLTTLETTGTTLEAALTGRLASHLCGGVAQGGPDLIELHLHDGSLGTILCLIGTLLEATGGNHAHALLQGLGAVVGQITPSGAPHEQRLTILELVGLTIPGSRGGSNREARHGRTAANSAQLGVRSEVAHDGDDGFTCHNGPSYLP